MRAVERDPHVAIFELRGGTHLILLPNDEVARRRARRAVRSHGRRSRGDAPRVLGARGIEPSADHNRPHPLVVHGHGPGRPGVTVNSSHVVGECEPSGYGAPVGAPRDRGRCARRS